MEFPSHEVDEIDLVLTTLTRLNMLRDPIALACLVTHLAALI